MTLKFYQNLGRLFYAIAAADKNLENAEFDKLKAVVKKQWLDIDALEDDYHTDAAYQIEIVFDWLNKQDVLNPEKYYNTFINYKNEQPHLFSKPIKKLILRTALAVANSFAGVNKSELIILAKLDIELKK